MSKILIIERIWEMGLQASLMVPFVAMCSLLLHKQSKKYSYALWLLVIMRLLVPVFVESPIAAKGFFLEKQQVNEEKSAGEMQRTDREGMNTLNLGEESGNGVVQAAKQSEGSDIISGQYKKHKIENTFAVIWLAGVTFTGLYFFLQFIRVKRQVAMAVWRDRNVWLCDRIPTPFVMGVVNPKIYIPFHLNEKEEHCILEHENMHICRYDHLVRLLGMLAVCMHWWNPLVWIAINRMNQDMEMCCDEAVVSAKSVEERKQYMTALLHFAIGRQRYMGVVAFGECQTEKRVLHLLTSHRRNWKITALVTVVAVILCTGAFTVQGKADKMTQADILQKEKESRNDISNGTLKTDSQQDTVLYDDLKEIWGITEEQAEKLLEEFAYALRTDNRKWIAQHFSYPSVLKMEDKEIRIENEEDLLSYYDDIFTIQYVEQTRQWVKDGFWANWQGVTLGNGNIWFYLENDELMISALVNEGGKLAIRPVISSKQ